MVRLVGYALLGVMLFLVLDAAAFVAAQYYKYRIVRDRENRAYAKQVFEGVVPFDTVLASNRWIEFYPAQLSPGYELAEQIIPDGNGDLVCRVAAVELADNAAPYPPTVGAAQKQPPFDFLGDWMPTPIPVFDDRTWTSRHPCADDAGMAVMSRLATALSTEGSWWRGTPDAIDGRLYVYSKQQNLAVRMYYGEN